MQKKKKATAKDVLERNIARKNSGALYKYLIKFGHRKSVDVNDILARGFDANDCGGGRSGAATPQRALRILRKFPKKVDPLIVKRIMLQTYDLGLLCEFMRSQPGLVTPDDLHICVQNMSKMDNVTEYEGYIRDYLHNIETKYPELKDTPLWEAFITAELVHA